MKTQQIHYQELTAGKLREVLSVLNDNEHVSISQIDNRGDVQISVSPWLDNKTNDVPTELQPLSR